MKSFVKSLPPVLLILLFIYAAASKLADTAAFRGQLYNQAFPHGLADILLFALPAAELAAVLLLLFPRTCRAGLLLSLALLAAFTAYIALVLLGPPEQMPCSCGGVLSRMSWGTHLLFNCIFILIAIAGLVFPAGEKEGKPKT